MFQQEISVTLTSHSTQYVGKPNNKSSKILPEMSGINHLQMEGLRHWAYHNSCITHSCWKNKTLGAPQSARLLLARHPPIRRSSCSDLPLLGQSWSRLPRDKNAWFKQ